MTKNKNKDIHTYTLVFEITKYRDLLSDSASSSLISPVTAFTFVFIGLRSILGIIGMFV